MGKLPQTPRAKQVIEYAIEEARNMDHHYIGTEHILLGLTRETEGVASQVLRNIGLTLERVRSEVLNLLGAAPDTLDTDGGRLSPESEIRLDLTASRPRAEDGIEGLMPPLVNPPYPEGRQGDGVRHIVMWRLKDHAEGATKAENALRSRPNWRVLPGTL